MRDSRAGRWAPMVCIAVALAAGGATVLAESAEESDDPYQRSIRAWQEDRGERLRKPDGWLSLTGLFWLEEGVNTVGRTADNRIVIPGAGVPDRIGAVRLEGGRVRFDAAPGSDVLHEGEPVTTIDLASDADGAPTVLEQGSRRFYVIRRQDRFGIRLKDSRSRALREFSGLEYYPIDPAWRVSARFVPAAPGQSLRVPNVIGTVADQPSPGTVEFERNGRTFRIEALQGSRPTELFLVFGDATNGAGSYGGGRFLYADVGEGGVDLDFNRSYSPPCVFTPFATCPLPPAVNRLDLRIEAGEKSYAGGVH